MRLKTAKSGAAFHSWPELPWSWYLFSVHLEPDDLHFSVLKYGTMQPISPSRFQKACCSLQICRSPFFDMSTCHLGYLLSVMPWLRRPRLSDTSRLTLWLVMSKLPLSPPKLDSTFSDVFLDESYPISDYIPHSTLQIENNFCSGP